jgi:predicted dehydrogenase
MIKTGIIGYGYWGPNIVRNFNANSSIDLVKVCDKSSDRLKVLQDTYPDIKAVEDVDDIFNDTSIDLVGIITPVFTHFELAKKALNNGKHVFIEKPFTSTSDQAKELIEIAKKKNLLIMVDHTFLFTGAVKKMKELIQDGSLGDLYYYNSVRINLGLFQHDINVIWDLAPHDISIMNYIIPDKKPISVNAVGAGHIRSDLADVAYLTVKYENDFIAHFNSNWLSPVKLRQTLVAGDKQMLVWDDLEQDNKIKIYDKGVEVKDKNDIYNLLISYRSGDMFTPKIENLEALKLETEYLVECIENNNLHPINDGIAGLEVVRILEASNESLRLEKKVLL